MTVRSFSPIRRLAGTSHAAAVCDFAPSGQNHAIALSEQHKRVLHLMLRICGK
jgi:hypothetical protein